MRLSIVVLAIASTASCGGGVVDVEYRDEEVVGSLSVSATSETRDGLLLVTMSIRNNGPQRVTVNVNGGTCMILTKGFVDSSRTHPPVWNELESPPCLDVGGDRWVAAGEVLLLSVERGLSQLGARSASMYFITAATRLDGQAWVEVAAGSIVTP